MNHEILVELKNGESIYGKLTDCDSWMNLTLSDVVVTYNEGEKFSKVPEIYIRGMHIKALRLPDMVMDHAREQNMLNMEQRNRNQKRRGGFQRRGDGQRHNGNFRGNGRRNYNAN